MIPSAVMLVGVVAPPDPIDPHVFFSSSLRAKKISASCELARGASLAYMIDVFYSELQFFLWNYI